MAPLVAWIRLLRSVLQRALRLRVGDHGLVRGADNVPEFSFSEQNRIVCVYVYIYMYDMYTYIPT